MFEPLKEILNRHGDTFSNHLASIRAGIVAIAGNTEAALTRNQFARKSVQLPKESTGQLRNDTAYGWLIKWVATSTSKVNIYIGTEGDESFFATLDPATPGAGHERVEWYVPVGGVIFVKTEGEETYVNFEVEVLVSEAAKGHTGPSDEHISVMRREPVPSGTPLDTPVADDPPPSTRM